MESFQGSGCLVELEDFESGELQLELLILENTTAGQAPTIKKIKINSSVFTLFSLKNIFIKDSRGGVLELSQGERGLCLSCFQLMVG